jgi:hypothetical protein
MRAHARQVCEFPQSHVPGTVLPNEIHDTIEPDNRHSTRVIAGIRGSDRIAPDQVMGKRHSQ